VLIKLFLNSYMLHIGYDFQQTSNFFLKTVANSGCGKISPKEV